MSAHTPGPWEWSTSNSWRRLSSYGNDGDVMYPTHDRHDGHEDLQFPNGGFEGPDARLIAAAPELYEAACAMLSSLDRNFGVARLSKDKLRWECPECNQTTCDPETCGTGNILRAADKLQAAISKVEHPR